MYKLLPKITSLLCVLILFSCNSSNKVSTIDFHDGTYSGELDDKGRKHGIGTYKWLDGSFYEGDFEKDLRNGSGHFKWANGETYKGDYLLDQRTGQGIYTWPDGSVYEGYFLNGKRHGRGFFSSVSGAKYDGEWFDDRMHGTGKLTTDEGKEIHGIWTNGVLSNKPMNLPTPAAKPEITAFPKKDFNESKFEAIEVEPPHEVNSSVTSKISPTELLANEFADENTDVSSVPMEPATPYDPDPLAEKKEIEEPIIAKPLAKEKIDIPTNTINPITQITDITSENEDDVWTGTTQDVETIFETKLIEGIDTVLYRKTNRRFSGKMKIVDSTGNRKGELELVNGRMNGEELYFENEKLVEKNLWNKGKFIKSIPIN